MSWFASKRYSLPRILLLACAVMLGSAQWQQAAAAEGPFANFPGGWDGNGSIHIGAKTERIRCKGHYSLQDASATKVTLQLTCASDSYKFELSGTFTADGSNKITGSWNEASRGVGGSASGSARGDTFQLHFESPAITGNLVMVTRAGSQSVTIDTIGTQDKISASIALRRTSR
jgi:hypothetical protein